jgi:hypothetical protein
VMQVFGASQTSTTVILMAHPDGTIRYYDGPEIIRRNAYDTWWNLKVAHNTAGSGELRFYVDDQLVLTKGGRGRATHYFKTGVYSVRNGSRSENRVRNVKYWRRGAGVSILPAATPFAGAWRGTFVRLGGTDRASAWIGWAGPDPARNLLGRRMPEALPGGIYVPEPGFQPGAVDKASETAAGRGRP